jgi:hypothetical protein
MTSGKRLAVALGIGMMALLGSLSAAQAQYAPPPPYYPPPPPPRGMYRGGLVVGFGVGVGAITADNCVNCGGGAGGLEFHIGAMVNPRLAVLFEGWGLARPVENGGTLTNSMAAGAVQFWVNDVFWVKGLLGFGTVRFSYDDSYYYGGSVSESAFAIGGAAGFEIMQSNNFALDLQFRVAHMAYDFGGANNIAAMVGFNWY